MTIFHFHLGINQVLDGRFIVNLVDRIFDFIPLTGWFFGLVINMYVMKLVLECSMIEAFLAIVLWGGSIMLALVFADQLILPI